MSAGARRGAIDTADASRRPPVVFIHGLWLRPNSWDRWVEMFEAAGYAGLAPGWPVEVGGAAAPETIGEAVTHFTGIVEALNQRPAIVGHSFGGLIALILAGQGLSAATVAIDPAPFRASLSFPISAKRSALPVWQHKANARQEVSLPPEQGRYILDTGVPESRGEALQHVYQALAATQVSADQNPWTQAHVNAGAPQRGPLLVISREHALVAPPSVARAAYEGQRDNRRAITEFIHVLGHGPSITIDNSWHELAQITLGFVTRFL